jgi:hypothetical protein
MRMGASFHTGPLPLRPRDLTQLRQNGVAAAGRPKPPRPFRPLSRRSGRIPALPYPPLRFFQSGRHQPRRAMISHRTAITPLTRCLTPGVHFSLSPLAPLRHCRGPGDGTCSTVGCQPPGCGRYRRCPGSSASVSSAESSPISPPPSPTPGTAA